MPATRTKASARKPATPAAGKPATPQPRFFRDAEGLRAWFVNNHTSADELWLGYYKKGSGVPSVSYAEAVDEALCVGWIDGMVRSLDGKRYMQRFTPRRARSIWSNVNVAKVERLIADGRMTAAGLAAFEARTPERTGIYSFEQDVPSELSGAELATFRKNARAWAYFSARAPSYQRAAVHWVTSGKRAETRVTRLATLIRDSAAGRLISLLRPRPGKR